MNIYRLDSLFFGALLTATMLVFPAMSYAADTSGPVACKDGTTSSHGGRGACSGHGGIDKAAKPPAGDTSASTAASSSAGAAGGASTSSTAGPVPCNDGTTSARGGRGACSGHGGVNKSGRTSSGGAATSSQPAAPSAAAPPSASGQSQAPDTAAQMPKSQPMRQAAAPGGGAGRVWVNTDSKVYHCPADRWYGKTKQGQYMTESEAKAQGNRPDHNKPCS